MPQVLDSLWSLLVSASPAYAPALILLLLMKRKLVLGWQYDDMVAQRDYERGKKDEALTLLSKANTVGEGVISVAERVTRGGGS